MSEQESRADRRQVYAIVRGSVQGVGFRYHTLWQATNLGLGGWVKNNYNGSVEVLFEGSPDAVDTMVRWLGHGPSSAHVRDLYTQERTPTGLGKFEITY